jgi:hypothetical protein
VKLKVLRVQTHLNGSVQLQSNREAVKMGAMSENLRIRLAFQNNFSDEEIEEYRRYFEGLGEIETEKYEQPAAGPAFGLQILIFIAGAIASGAAYDAAKNIPVGLLKIWRRREEKKQYRPEASALSLTFSDWKIVLTYDDRGRYSPDEFSIDHEVIEKLADLIPPIKEHLLAPPLSTGSFRSVVIPVRCEGEKDERLIKPVWKLAAPTSGRAYGFGTYYDSVERKIFEITEPKLKADRL